MAQGTNSGDKDKNCRVLILADRTMILMFSCTRFCMPRTVDIFVLVQQFNMRYVALRVGLVNISVSILHRPSCVFIAKYN